MSPSLVFDLPHATRFTEVRRAFFEKWLPALVASQGLRTALDVGCGVGHFTDYLAGLGLRAVGVDARQDNVVEAQRRHPQIEFVVGNIEDPIGPGLGLFDVVLCFGLLYHLENPFAAVRNLHDLPSSGVSGGTESLRRRGSSS